MTLLSAQIDNDTLFSREETIMFFFDVKLFGKYWLFEDYILEFYFDEVLRNKLNRMIGRKESRLALILILLQKYHLIVSNFLNNSKLYTRWLKWYLNRN